MHRTMIVALAVGIGLYSPLAHAHFIWFDVKGGGDDRPRAQLYFSEQPEPGEPRLIGKIAHSKAWARGIDGEVTPLTIHPAQPDQALLPVEYAPQQAASLEAICDYGVYERGPGVLLHYYAKHLAGDWTAYGEKLSRAAKLTLDIVPQHSGGQLNLQVFYQGKPSSKADVTLIDPQGAEHELQTDSDGRTATAAAPGRYAIRTGYVEANKSGERNGKKFAQTWHYCTLTFDLPRDAQAAAREIPAMEALKRAREARAVWQDFPGFTAELEIQGADQQVSGKVSIDASGGVSLDMAKSPLADWAEEQLQSLVQHRMPDGEVSEGDVKYADHDLAHPLGRKIDLGDPSLQSVYRIKDDAITEVNRSMGKLRFTISVLELVRNAENKYLPRAFTMSFFDAASGELKTSLAYWNEWQRIGRFDLPKTILEIGARQGGTGAKQLVFKNCRLIEAK